MVRFIIFTGFSRKSQSVPFTFQYGQIYYEQANGVMNNALQIYIPIWLDLLCLLDCSLSVELYYLHSNMVRFIIMKHARTRASIKTFTFQYGQIYYLCWCSFSCPFIYIYIPIWLDLLYKSYTILQRISQNLHSNMVRFIIVNNQESDKVVIEFTFQYGQIYYYTQQY